MDGLLLVMDLEGLRPNAKDAVELDGYGWGFNRKVNDNVNE